jgi:hypothetical protein
MTDFHFTLTEQWIMTPCLSLLFKRFYDKFKNKLLAIMKDKILKNIMIINLLYLILKYAILKIRNS